MASKGIIEARALYGLISTKLKEHEKEMTSLVFSSEEPCIIGAGGAFCAISASFPLVMPCADDHELFFTVWAQNDKGSENGVPIPVMHRIRISGGAADTVTLPVVDWGGVIEIPVRPLFLPAGGQAPPMLLSSIGWRYDGRPARAELFRDDGLRLAVVSEGREPVSFALGAGDTGSLRLFDVGSARLLVVLAIARGSERLIMLDQNAGVLLDVSGDRASIEDGFPTVTQRMGTVRGHARKTRFEFSGGAFVKLPESVVFVEGEPNEPANETQRALAAVQETALGFESAAEFFEPGLARKAGEEGFKSFFGSFDEARPYPMELREGEAIVGLITNDGPIARPKKFLFAFSGGLITDAEEL